MRRASRSAPWPVALAALAALAGGCRPAAPGAAASGAAAAVRGPTTVLLVIVDTLRADHLGCYGGKSATTPVADGLAARGTRFANAVCPTPLTRPSITSLLTGLYPARHGVRDNAGERIPPSVPTLAERFAAGGYRTAAFVSGEPVDATSGLGRGFGHYDDHLDAQGGPGYGYGYAYGANVALRERRGEATVAAATAWLAAAGPAPVFCLVHLFDPHAPYAAPPPEGVKYAGAPYAGEVAYADRCVGILLAAAAAAGRADPLVVLLADHGEGLGEHGEDTHGHFLYETTVRIPLLIAGPGVRRGHVEPGLARTVDVAPTLLALCGLAPLPADGAVLGSALTATPAAPGAPAEAFLETFYSARHYGWAPLDGVRTVDAKLVAGTRNEAYDLGGDPHETRDIAAGPEAAARLAGLKASLDRFRALVPVAAPAPGGTGGMLSPYGADVRSAVRGTGRDPRGGTALIRLLDKGRSAAGAGRHAEALELFREVLRGDAANPTARAWVAHCLRHRGEHAAAATEYLALDAALSDAGRPNAEVLRGLIESQAAAGKRAEAETALARYARLWPEDAWPHAKQGAWCVAGGDAAGAVAAYEKAVALAPGDVRALGNLGAVLEAAGREADGVARLLDALRVAPGDAGLRRQAADVAARVTAKATRPGAPPGLAALGKSLAAAAGEGAK